MEARSWRSSGWSAGWSLEWPDALLGQQGLPHTCVPCTLLCVLVTFPERVCVCCIKESALEICRACCWCASFLTNFASLQVCIAADTLESAALARCSGSGLHSAQSDLPVTASFFAQTPGGWQDQCILQGLERSLSRLHCACLLLALGKVRA